MSWWWVGAGRIAVRSLSKWPGSPRSRAVSRTELRLCWISCVGGAIQAARIGLLDPERGAPISLVSHGYNEAVSAYHDSPAVVEEFELLGLDRERPPIRIRDLPVPPVQVRGWAEYLQPAGFREGLAVGLFTVDGRHLGVLGLNTDTEAHPTEAARHLIGRPVPMIAYAVDPLRSIVAAARLVRDASAGIVLTLGGNALRCQVCRPIRSCRKVHPCWPW